MRFDRRYGNEIDPDQSLLEQLAARYDLSEERARDLLKRARRDAAGDEYRRPVETWVSILVREERAPAPGKRTRVMGGRRSMVGAGESVDVVPGRWTRTHAEAIRLEERRAFLAKMREAYGPQVDGVEIHEGSREVPAGRKALARGGQIHVESGLELDGAHGEQVIAHELAHVAQQTWRGGGWDDEPPSRGALEADAHAAAEQAIAGRAADVRLAAPAAMALGYSEGEAPAKTRGGPPAGGGGGAPAPAPAAKSTPRGAAPAPARPAAPAAASADAPRVARGTDAPAAVGGGDGKRGRGADGVLLPEAATGLSAQNQQRLGQVDARNQSAGAMTTALPSAQQSTDGARAAVEEPTAEQDARAQHGVVTEVDQRPPPSPEIEAACTRIREVIKNKRPPDEDKLVEAKPREMAAEAGAQMDAGVESRTDGVRQEYADVQQSPKGQPSREPVPVQLPPPAVETPAVDAGAGAPEPSAPEETSLDDDVAAQEQKLDDAGMNTEPAKLVQDGPIGDARGGVGELKGMAKTDPAKVRLEQGKAIAKAQADMRNLQAAADKALADARAGTVTGVGAQSKEIKGSEEQQRARAGQEMQAIFQRTQKTVDGLLTPLARTALAKWQAGVDKLSTEFEGRLAHVKAKIEERYKSEDNGNPLDELGAMWNKGTDAVFGLPDWVVVAYDAAEGAFASGCMDLLRDISRDVNDVIEKCKQLIQQARKDIDAIVEKLPASLQSWARGEADRLGKELDKLDQKVTDTQKNINKDLVARAFGAVQDVRQRVHELREAAKGLIGKIADAVGAFLANPAKAIVDGLLRVLGISPESFWAMVGRLGDVIGAIAKEPLKFANTLIQGVAQGFGRFFDKFPQHIGESIFGWIFGTLGAAGVSMPSDFSGAGILASMLGMFGIDGGLVASMVGEGMSPEEMAEAQGELGAVSGGPMAIVDLLREHLDPGAMMAMIKQAALEFLLTAIITRVAMRIVMLFNPAGAILQAIEAILRVMVWVVTNAARIFTLIETLVAGAGQIIAGNVAGAAALVESALVQIIVPVIDFLAGYLGLGGLPGKIREIIAKLRGKVEAALKKVTGAISGRAKAKAKAKRAQKPEAKKDAARDDDDDAAQKPKRDDEEENDPRKGKDRPDENDPRRVNRKDDDDGGPDRKRRKDGDDDGPDGTKRRKDDDDGPDGKKRKDDDDGDDMAAARRAARQAADRAWAAARARSSDEVLARGELEAILARADRDPGKAVVTLEIEERGTSWTVRAEARVGAAHARDTEGNGWIARDAGGQRFYAARDMSAFNKDLIADGFRELKQPAPVPDQKSNAERAEYDEKARDGKTVVAGLQRRLDAQMRGMTVGIEMEPWSGVEQDRRIATTLTVTPNTARGSDDVELAPLDAVELTDAATMHGGTERVRISAGESRIQIGIGSYLDLAAFTKIAVGPLGDAVNQAGQDALIVARNEVDDVMSAQRERVTVRDGKVPRAQHAGLKEDLATVRGTVETLGHKLRAPSILHACKTTPAPAAEVSFKTYVPKDAAYTEYSDKYELEMTRQLAQQEKGLNELTLDTWVINRELFRASDVLKSLHDSAAQHVLQIMHNRCVKSRPAAEQRERELRAETALRHQEYKAMTAANTTEEVEAAHNKYVNARKRRNAKTRELDGYVRALKELPKAMGGQRFNPAELRGAGGREDLQAEWAKTHEAAKKAIVELVKEDNDEFKEWENIVETLGDLAVLHDPDQIAGGHGSINAVFDVVDRPPNPEDDTTEWMDYLRNVQKHFGVIKINSSIGSQWAKKAPGEGKTRIETLYRTVIGNKVDNPPEVYGLRTLNVTLTAT